MLTSFIRKFSSYCGSLLEEEEHFFNTLQDSKLLKSVVRPVFHQGNCNRKSIFIIIVLLFFIYFNLVLNAISGTNSATENSF